MGRSTIRPNTIKPIIVKMRNAAEVPEALKMSRELMKTFDGGLPPGLQPRWLRNKTNMKISKGMTPSTVPRVK